MRQCLYSVDGRDDTYRLSNWIGFLLFDTNYETIYSWNAAFQCYAYNTTETVDVACGSDTQGADSNSKVVWNWSDPGTISKTNALEVIGTASTIVHVIITAVDVVKACAPAAAAAG